MKTLNQFMMESYLREEQLEEKNVPTSPEKWARAKAAAKSKFAVYPSAYANGWASKKYKSMGGGWKSVSEEQGVAEGTRGNVSDKSVMWRDEQDNMRVYHKGDEGYEAAKKAKEALKKRLTKKGDGKLKEQGVAEGEVKQFPKKHRGDLEDTHSCVKCGGDLQGGTYMGHKVKVCIPCKQVYLPPNTGIDQRGNKVDEQGVAEEVELDETAAWQRKEGKRESGGLNQKGVESYRREHPGSKLKTAVTTKPSKLKPGSKAANRRKSFCARMSGMKKRLTSAKTANDPDSRINKSLRKWNC